MIYKFDNLTEVIIDYRPSKKCKTPYVADITLNDEEYLLHCPALGCCGLSEKGSTVLISKIENSKTKCKYKCELAKITEKGYEYLVGINPKLAEKLMYNMLDMNICPFVNVKFFKPEQKRLNSRFDFVGKDTNDIDFILEIKNVPLADYVDVPKKERKKYNTENIEYNKKIAYFPDGYRKTTKEVVSERALKHVTELKKIKEEKKEYIRCILCFVIQREDVSVFQTSVIDPIYKKAVKEAMYSGVEIYAIQFKWGFDGSCNYLKMLDINL